MGEVTGAQALFQALTFKADVPKTDAMIFDALCKGVKPCGLREKLSLIRSAYDHPYMVVPTSGGGYHFYRIWDSNHQYPSPKRSFYVIEDQSTLLVHHSVAMSTLPPWSEVKIIQRRDSDFAIDSSTGKLLWQIICSSNIDEGKPSGESQLKVSGDAFTYSSCGEDKRALRFTHERLGQCDKAVSPDVEKAIRKQAKSYRKDAMKHLKAKRYQKAIEELKNAKVHDPGNDWIDSEIGYFYQRAGLLHAAKSYFKTTLRKTKSQKLTSMIYFNLSLIAEKDGDMGSAKSYCESAVKANPKSKGAQKRLKALSAQ